MEARGLPGAGRPGRHLAAGRRSPAGSTGVRALDGAWLETHARRRAVTVSYQHGLAETLAEVDAGRADGRGADPAGQRGRDRADRPGGTADAAQVDVLHPEAEDRVRRSADSTERCGCLGEHRCQLTTGPRAFRIARSHSRERVDPARDMDPLKVFISYRRVGHPTCRRTAGRPDRHPASRSSWTSMTSRSAWTSRNGRLERGDRASPTCSWSLIGPRFLGVGADRRAPTRQVRGLGRRRGQRRRWTAGIAGGAGPGRRREMPSVARTARQAEGRWRHRQALRLTHVSFNSDVERS